MNKFCQVCGGDMMPNKNGQLQCSFCGFIDNQASEQYSNKNTNEGVDVFDANINGVLEVACVSNDGQSTWAGSGFLITEEGFAITNAHVAADKNGLALNDGHVKVRICNQIVDAQVVALADNEAGHGKGVDLALLKMVSVPFQARPLAFADFNMVRNGEQVFVIGNSLGDGTCITSGIVSDKLRILPGSNKQVLMTDCPINGGNSGGPIFNKQGQVIGVICASRVKNGRTAEGMNYAIPCTIAEIFVKQYFDKYKR